MTLGSHQRTIGKSQEWITPKFILDTLGRFDLDPCAAKTAPWRCAKKQYFEHGLELDWFGRVWLNPPFHRYQIVNWIAKLAAHGDGIALLHARTETEWFGTVWAKSSAVLFLAQRIHFYHPNGLCAAANSGAPPCLVAFGATNAEALRASKLAGYLVTKWELIG